MKKLDFRFYAGKKKIGAPFNGLKAFFTTGQLNVLDKVSSQVKTAGDSWETCHVPCVTDCCCIKQFHQ